MLRISGLGQLAQSPPVSMRRVYWVAGLPTPTDVVYVTPTANVQYILKTRQCFGRNTPVSVTSIVPLPVVRAKALCLRALLGPCGDMPARNLAARLRSRSRSSRAPSVARSRVAKGTELRTNLDITVCSNGTRGGGKWGILA